MKKVAIEKLRNGTIVKVGNRYGVVEGVIGRGDQRIVDFWDGGREHVPAKTLVQVLK